VIAPWTVPVYGVRYIFGNDSQNLPIGNAPAGARVRLRYRAKEFATAFVKTKDGITQHYLQKSGNGNFLLLGPQVGSNQRSKIGLSPRRSASSVSISTKEK
jgi:hypothetical protein